MQADVATYFFLVQNFLYWFFLVCIFGLLNCYLNFFNSIKFFSFKECKKKNNCILFLISWTDLLDCFPTWDDLALIQTPTYDDLSLGGIIDTQFLFMLFIGILGIKVIGNLETHTLKGYQFHLNEVEGVMTTIPNPYKALPNDCLDFIRYGELSVLPDSDLELFWATNTFYPEQILLSWEQVVALDFICC